MGPVLYLAVSVLLWRFAGAVFVPQLIARRLFAAMPALQELETVIIINAAIVYFGLYFVFALEWQAFLRTRLKHPFLAALVLWVLNALVLFPLIGRGMLGYRLPQGWLAVNLPLWVSHWIFARGLQFQQRK